MDPDDADMGMPGFKARVDTLAQKIKARGYVLASDMCHAGDMALHEMSEDEKNTLKHAAKIEDTDLRVGAVLDIVQTIVDKHVAQRSADMTARFQQSLDDYLNTQQQEGAIG